jgi:ACS family glucarate transporter-like MFS transporter
MGAGQGILFPATSRAVANWFNERERGAVTGVYLTGVRFGLALISWLGALFLARYDWRLFFVVTGLMPLVWAFFWVRFLNRWETPAVPSGPASPAAKQALLFSSSLGLLKLRTVLGIFLGFFAYDYAWYVFVTWLPGYLTERGFTKREMGLYSAFSYLIMSAIIVGSGLLSDRLVKRGRPEITVRKIFIVVGLAIGCLVVPAGVVADKMTAMWLLTISLSGIGIAAPNTWTLTQAVCEQRIVGTVTGIQNFGGNLGGIIAPALTGLIAQATGSFALALGLSGAVTLLGIVAYWVLVGDRVTTGAGAHGMAAPNALATG